MLLDILGVRSILTTKTLVRWEITNSDEGNTHILKMESIVSF